MDALPTVLCDSEARGDAAGRGDAVGRGLTRLNSSRHVEGRDVSCSLPTAATEYYKFARQDRGGKWGL